MGQKVNPIGIRLGYSKDWSSKYAGSGAAQILKEDIAVRRFIEKKCKKSWVSRVLIERPYRNAKVTILVGSPGGLIGNKGKGIDLLRTDLTKIMSVPVHVSIEEVKKPELDANIVAQKVARQLEDRVMYRRVIKRTLSNAMRLGAKGAKVKLGGRLGGAEIARSEWSHEGRVPLHTFKADIDYATASAKTTYGIIGIKVWIFKGDIQFSKSKNN